LSIESLFDRPAALPVVPKIVHHLIESFRREDVSIDEIAVQLEADPVLSAKTLRLANSAYFHVSRRIATIDEALQMLGFVMVRNLVLGVAVAGSFRGVPGIDLPQFWRHSLHTASGASWLARHAKRDADLAFTIGLVQGLGQLVMHMAQPGQLRLLDDRCHPLAAGRAAQERRVFGYHSFAVSAELALRWNFPPEVTHPLRAVADPLGCDPPMAMSALVHIAAWRARVEEFGDDAERAVQSCPVDVGRAIGLDLAWLPEQAALLCRHPGSQSQMPAPSELCHGLEAMLE
jgi:HD-like signal output (HDOD) protein